MKTKTYVIMTGVILLAACSAQGVLTDKTFTSSGQILPGEDWANVYIYNDDTIVDMLGGSVDSMATYDASTLNVLDGYVSTLEAYEFSTANVSGGQVYSLWAFDFGTARLSDAGSVFSLIARDSGVVNMTGGTADHGSALESGILNVFGGIISDGIGADYTGTLNMSGGVTEAANFRGEATANLYGGTISDSLIATEDSLVNIFGYDLVLTSWGGSYGYGQVYGYWLDDTPFMIELNGAETYTHINLIPEPGSLALLGLGALLLRRKR
ncbi:MAG: PEP-CTERM sorting domain-containing protein [Planctomycetota bacterium]|jgi:hypothetical protein